MLIRDLLCGMSLFWFVLSFHKDSKYLQQCLPGPGDGWPSFRLRHQPRTQPLPLKVIPMQMPVSVMWLLLLHHPQLETGTRHRGAPPGKGQVQAGHLQLVGSDFEEFRSVIILRFFFLLSEMFSMYLLQLHQEGNPERAAEQQRLLLKQMCYPLNTQEETLRQYLIGPGHQNLTWKQ